MAAFSMPPAPAEVDLRETKVTSNMVVVSVLFSLSAVFVGLRIFTRLNYQRKKLDMDDHLMNAGLVLNAANLACCIIAARFGLGKHMWALDSQEMRHISLIHFAFLFVYAWSVSVIKLSIITFYRRIFGMSWLCWLCTFLTIGYLLAHHVVLPLFASPVSYYWDKYLGNAGRMCVDEPKFILAMAIINLIGDILILCIPIRKVLRLQLPPTQKAAVIVTFLLGSFVCFASLYRIITIVRFADSIDMSWTKSDVFIWSLVEPSIGIISACLPTLRPLLTKGLEKAGVGSRVGGARSGSGKSRQEGDRINLVETISQRRVRKVQKKDVLDETVGGDEEWHWTADEDDVGKHGKSGNGDAVPVLVVHR
ncbi:unnamed protein product [Periconia digitata]|uniref:Rhodopsin domain-containing protein n=1 Tax=Periconia digitata TaxID=1303443 RepID=A0A9W4UTL8_9PLEO|nr:unnamed protein product [Periconia digitata]